MVNFSVKNYWDSRYKGGGNSGWGSHDLSSVNFKKNYVNHLISKHSTKTVVELGCGDGNQLTTFKGYEKYYGHDISDNIIGKCKTKFMGDDSKEFTNNTDVLLVRKYDLSLSLDVIYHLVEDEVYEKYMHDLFNLSNLVCIFGTNRLESSAAPHCTHREISEFINKHYKEYKLIDTKMFNNTKVGFFLYEKK